MKPLCLWLFAAASVTSALRIPFIQSSPSQFQRRAGGTSFSAHKAVSFAAQASANDLDLNTVQDMIYMANVTVAGTEYIVQLDTGSSDLWVKGASSPLPNTNQTNIIHNLTYGIGWAAGYLAYADVQFAGIIVPSQAFLDVSLVDNPALSYGAEGILGLGFTSLSTIDYDVNSTGSSTGRSLLYNLFSDNPSEPNFISFTFQRDDDPQSDVQGVFSIGEYVPAYTAVANNSAIPTFPTAEPKRWTVLVDAILTDNGSVTPSTTVPNAPSNKAVALLDSGTSWSYVSPDICNAIYSNVPGAIFNTASSQWQVPCSAEIDIAIQIGGQVFPIDPLDVTPVSLSSPNTCVGSFVPQAVSVGADEFDWILGVNVLRSVYTVFDFGDYDQNHNMGNPYVKMLSIIDPNQASADFAQVRGATARTNITYNAANDTNADPASTSSNLSTDNSSTLDKISQLLPAILAIMGLNSLVITILLIAGAVYLCRRRRKRARAGRIRTPNGRMTPMPRNTGTPLEEHVYEPVSMAITEDTMLVPPSPGFRKLDGKAGPRPQSLATLPSQSGLYQRIGSEDALVPPSPSFFNGSRPKSVGMAPSEQPNFQPAPEDEPFVPPSIALQESDNISVRSGRSGISLRDEPAVSSQSMENLGPVPSSSSRPTSVKNFSRPQSVVVPPSSVQSPEDVLLPPSPGLSSGFSSPTNPTHSPSRSSVSPIARSASPGGSTLRPNMSLPPDRPMSVGMLPSQTESGDARFRQVPPPFHRQGSSLRPAAVDRPRSAMLPSQVGPQQSLEEDITTFARPAPAFHRSQSYDRPNSMA